MNFGEKILARLADWRPPVGAGASITVPDEAAGWTFTVESNRNDELGCLVREIGWSRTTAASAPADLQDWANTMAARLSGVLEAVEVIEVDPARKEAVLRSARVTRRGSSILYYEVLLRGTQSATLRRYQAAHEAKPREQVAFALTHEAIARLADDVTAG